MPNLTENVKERLTLCLNTFFENKLHTKTPFHKNFIKFFVFKLYTQHFTGGGKNNFHL